MTESGDTGTDPSETASKSRLRTAAEACVAAHQAHVQKQRNWIKNATTGGDIRIPDFADEVAEIHRTLRELAFALESDRRSP